MTPRISLVIPAFNETALLPRLLDSVDVARRRYAAGADAVEVIVADNASTDGTAELARARGCRVARVARRSIAAARNGGAAAAGGSIVAFVDADSQIHPDTFDVIDRTMADGRAVIGATGFRYDRMSLAMRVQWVFGVAVMKLARIDSGVVFCRRADWAAVGGYDEDTLAAEDVKFFFAMKKLGRARRQRFVRAPHAVTITSARKFDAYGDWHYLRNALRAAVWYTTRRGSFAQFIQRYWYEERL